jgi:cell filamentation protein
LPAGWRASARDATAGYAWAGSIRTIDITRGGSTFAHHRHIEAAARPIFRRLAEENHLAGLPADAFSERAAYYLAEINALHPFREGNGRAQREFISHLAYNSGYHISWKNISQAEMVQASIESFRGDSSKFAAYIRENLTRLNPSP